MLQLGLNKVSNSDYHADREFLSSSSIKLLLKNARKFHDKIILKTPEERVENQNFIIGSLVHSMILEPHLVAEEYAFFEGFRKQGKAYDEFKENNSDKTIVSASQLARCKRYVAAFERNRTAIALLEGCTSEHTICGEITGVKLKTRTDAINLDKGYSIDIKTSGYSVELETFKDAIARYQYELSAVLYSEIAGRFYEKDFDFFFIAISKSEETCEVYKLSEETKKKGYDLLMRGLDKYRTCLSSGKWVDEVSKPKTVGDYEILEV